MMNIGGNGMIQRPTMSLVLAPLPVLQQRLEPRMADHFYEAVNFWTTSNPVKVRFNMGGVENVVPFVVAPDDWVESMTPGEKYGFYVGEMMFLNDAMIKKNPKWAPFVVAKLHGERYVDNGLDPSGHQKHYDALFRTIRGAAGVMESGELYDFLTNLMMHERSGYFEWDEQAGEFLKGYGDMKEAKRAYLERHRQNKWVTMGRNWEAMAAADPEMVGGFRNHAEVLARRISGEGAGAVYSAALLVQELMREPFHGKESGPYVVEGALMSGLAYMLTREANGIVDIVRFVDEPLEGMGKQANAIVRINSRRSTWNALSKRLSQRMMQLEAGAEALIEGQREKLDGIVIDFNRLNDGAAIMLENARAIVRPNSDTMKAIANLEGSYPDAARALTEAAAKAAENMSALEQLRERAGALI